jgi:hypothetical protein
MRTWHAARSLRLLSVLALGVAGAAFLVSSTAFAAVTYLSQSRSVSTFAQVDFVVGEDPFNSDMFESQEIEQFEGAALCHAGVPGNEANSTAHQLSYLEAGSILAEGNMSAQAQVSGEATFAESFGLSFLTTRFSVDVPTNAQLLGGLIVGGGLGRVNFTFRIVDGALLVHQDVIGEGTFNLDESFTLQPGNYELLAQASGFGQAQINGGGEPALASFSFSLAFTSATASPEIASGLANPFAPVVAPNPVRGITHIAPATRMAPLFQALGDEIVILDLAGRVVRHFENVGESGVTWDTRDSNGSLVGAGVYLVRGRTGESTRAVVLR